MIRALAKIGKNANMRRLWNGTFKRPLTASRATSGERRSHQEGRASPRCAANFGQIEKAGTACAIPARPLFGGDSVMRFAVLHFGIWRLRFGRLFEDIAIRRLVRLDRFRFDLDNLRLRHGAGPQDRR